MGASQRGSPNGRESIRDGRLRLLAAVAESQGNRDGSEVLRAALVQAAAELGGLGGMAHLRAGGRSETLRLITVTGLPKTFTDAWTAIYSDGATAPARAMREGGAVWLSEVRAPEWARDAGVPAPRPSGLIAGAGMMAVPLSGPKDAAGALSVVTPPGSRPDPGECAFLEEMARWTSLLLRLSSPAPESLAPELLTALESEHGTWEPPRDTPGGRFTQNLRTGELDLSALPDALRADLDPSALDGRLESFLAAVHPDDLPWATAEADQGTRDHGGYELEYRVRRADGDYLWLRAHARVAEYRDGRPARMAGTMWDTTGLHQALQSVGRALRYMSDGFLAVDGDWRIGFVNVTAERLLGSTGDLTGRRLWDIPAVRAVPGLEEHARRAVAEEEPAGFDVRWPDSDRWYHLRPVPVPDGLTLYIADITERHAREAAQRAAAERAGFVVRLTRRLAEAVTVRDVVTAVSEGVLPAFGASGLVVFELDNDRLDVVGITGYPPEFRDRVHGQPADATTPLGQALRTGDPQYIDSARAHTARHPEAAELAAASDKQAWAFLPLSISGRRIGTFVVSFDRPRRLEDDERSLLTAISGLVAHALERASLYDDATTRARALQQALLPRALPALPAVTSAARYLPAGQGAEVGGDWYDVIPLSADRVALVIGDVMGHGMAEAATMGRLRTAARTLSELELPPGEILAHLNDLVAELGEERFATCLYGIYDPVTGHFTCASAGHPPPAIAQPDGVTTQPARTPDPPLGVAAPPFATIDTRLPDGTLLALYTDGLVATHALDIDLGIHHLTRLLHTGRTADTETLCQRITAELLPPDQPTRDDAALLLTRTHRIPPGNIASWPLPESPLAAREARDHIRGQLAAWHLDDDIETTTELIVSELVGNVIRHATGPIHLRLLRSRALISEVSDASLTTPHIRHPALTDEGGRGLQLVAAMAHRWGTRHTAHGKTIWAEQPIPH